MKSIMFKWKDRSLNLLLNIKISEVKIILTLKTVMKMTSNNKINRTFEKNMDRIMELLSKLRFYGMLETYRNDCRTTSSDGMTNDEFLKWLLESEYDYRHNVSIERLIRSANFRYKAYMEKIGYTIKRNLDRNQLERLASLNFIRDGQNILSQAALEQAKAI